MGKGLLKLSLFSLPPLLTGYIYANYKRHLEEAETSGSNNSNQTTERNYCFESETISSSNTSIKAEPCDGGPGFVDEGNVSIIFDFTV